MQMLVSLRSHASPISIKHNTKDWMFNILGLQFVLFVCIPTNFFWISKAMLLHLLLATQVP